jgi:hypothetical protein
MQHSSISRTPWQVAARQQDSIFLKQEKVLVLLNGRGFRYRLATGELTPAGAVWRECRSVPSALEAILGSTYAQA